MNKDEKKYSFKKYVYLSRWVSYWHQISEVLELNPQSILVIGKGDGIVADIIKKYVPETKVLDIDEKLNADIVASVENIPFNDNSFDVILCAEVLEHLPFEKFEKCIIEISRVSRNGVVLSLPHFSPQVKLKFKIPFIREVEIAPKIPFFIKHKFNQEHYWEIGKKGYSPAKIRKILKKYFIIKNEFIPFENQYHHFFALEKLKI